MHSSGLCLSLIDNDLRCLGSSREGCIREDHLPRALELANGIKVELRKRAGTFHVHVI